jgi:ATP-dependent Zn protease
VCQASSTGAHDDLTKASETARQMVTRLGMSEKLGPLSFGRQLPLLARRGRRSLHSILITHEGWG